MGCISRQTRPRNPAPWCLSPSHCPRRLLAAKEFWWKYKLGYCGLNPARRLPMGAWVSLQESFSTIYCGPLRSLRINRTNPGSVEPCEEGRIRGSCSPHLLKKSHSSPHVSRAFSSENQPPGNQVPKPVGMSSAHRGAQVRLLSPRHTGKAARRGKCADAPDARNARSPDARLALPDGRAAFWRDAGAL